MLVLVFLGLCLKSTHLLSLLISLEFLGLLVFFIFFSSWGSVFVGYLILLFLLGAMGCESALGLVFFVLLTRSHSKDYLLGTSLLKF